MALKIAHRILRITASSPVATIPITRRDTKSKQGSSLKSVFCSIARLCHCLAVVAYKDWLHFSKWLWFNLFARGYEQYSRPFSELSFELSMLFNQAALFTKHPCLLNKDGQCSKFYGVFSKSLLILFCVKPCFLSFLKPFQKCMGF